MEEWVFVDTCIWASFFSKPSVARRCNTWVYTTDPYFDIIPDLKRFWPGK